MRVQEQLLSYRGLVVNQAKKSWSQLPKQTRAWIGLDDMIEMGMYFLWHTAKKRWSPNKGASFGSYAKRHLPYYFANKVGQPFGMSQKRSEVNTDSIQTLEAKHAEYGDSGFQIENLIENYYCDLSVHMVSEVILKLYDDASPVLKAQLVKWFLYPDKTKVHTSGNQFRTCKKEFRKLAAKYSLTIDECRYMLRSPTCLDLLSRKAMDIPYDLNHPTPGIRGYAN